jgi:hypothetical protein
MGALRKIVIAVSAGVAAGAASAADFGAEPSWDGARAQVEDALRTKMIDPASTQIRWPYGFVPGTFKRMFGAPQAGYWTCGRINSKAQSGDYVGEVWFVVLMKDGAILTLDRGNNLEVTYASALCEEAIAKGQLKPVAAEVAAAVPDSPAVRLGIGFVPDAAGAVIELVDPGSPADRAGLRVGQVIEAVNGAPIKGLAAPEMIKAVRATTPVVFLSIVGGCDVKVVREAS